jgi:hypothetical protein
MKWPWNPRKPALTLAQLAIENLLAKLTELPVGESVVLKDRAGDGLGGLQVTRHSEYTLIFQRVNRLGRWHRADGTDEVRGELQAYVASGKLREPDKTKGW